MPTVRLNNGDIEADGSLNALSVTTQEIQADNLNVTGQLIASGDVTANRILGNVNVTGSFNTAEVNAGAVSVSIIHGLTNILGDVTAGSIQASAINGLTTIQGDLSLDGNLTANSVVVDGSISSIGSLQADVVDVGSNLLVNGSVQTPNLSIPGTLDVDNLSCATLNGSIQVNGQADVESLNVSSTVAALSLECSNANIDAVESSSINALTVNVKDTLNISGDLIVDGDDDRVLGEVIIDTSQGGGPLSLDMRHNHWYNTEFISLINILADTDSGRVKTCYIISYADNPLVLNGVQWLWAPVDLEDTSKTHVIALQQIGAGPVMANIAYSYPV